MNLRYFGLNEKNGGLFADLKVQVLFLSLGSFV